LSAAPALKILCTNALKTVVSALAPEFERARGGKLDLVWGSTQRLVDRIGAGEGGDLAILSAEAIDELIRRGSLAPGSRTDLGRSFIGVGVRKGTTKPDIGTAEAFKAALRAARSITYSKTGISGIYFRDLLERLGLADAMRAKTVLPQPGVSVGEALARGEAEIGVQQISELMPVPGLEIVGPLPPPLQKVSVLSAGLFTHAADAAGARALVEALTAPAARAVYQGNGLEPVA
jgi:molybdate transport system substrate-binding protein